VTHPLPKGVWVGEKQAFTSIPFFLHQHFHGIKWYIYVQPTDFARPALKLQLLSGRWKDSLPVRVTDEQLNIAPNLQLNMTLMVNVIFWPANDSAMIGNQLQIGNGWLFEQIRNKSIHVPPQIRICKTPKLSQRSMTGSRRIAGQHIAAFAQLVRGTVQEAETLWEKDCDVAFCRTKCRATWGKNNNWAMRGYKGIPTIAFKPHNQISSGEAIRQHADFVVADNDYMQNLYSLYKVPSIRLRLVEDVPTHIQHRPRSMHFTTEDPFVLCYHGNADHIWSLAFLLKGLVSSQPPMKFLAVTGHISIERIRELATLFDIPFEWKEYSRHTFQILASSCDIGLANTNLHSSSCNIRIISTQRPAS